MCHLLHCGIGPFIVQTLADISLVKYCHMCDLQHHGTDLFWAIYVGFSIIKENNMCHTSYTASWYRAFFLGHNEISCVIHRGFYTQTLLHADAFTHTHTFTHRGFYTQKLLHTEAFTHRRFYTQTPLHTDTFTHRHFYPQKLLHTHTLAQKHLIELLMWNASHVQKHFS